MDDNSKPKIQLTQDPVTGSPILKLAYNSNGSPLDTTFIYRTERGVPFHRAGTTVVAKSQFKTLPLNVPVTQAAVTAGQLDPSQPGFLQKGSNVTTFTTIAFTFNATSTTALTISWPATALRRANRQPTLNISSDTQIPAGSVSITGLTAGTQYWYYPFWSEAAKIFGWAGAGNATSAGSPAIAQTAQSDAVLQAAFYQGFVPLNVLSFTQPSMGTSSQTGGYGTNLPNITGGGRTYRLT